MRILFCDDNPEILDQLQKYVTDFFKGMGKLLPEMAAYTSGDDLLQKERYADIAFLDVEMPGRSGIHVGARLKEFNPKIKVFIVTSFPDYRGRVCQDTFCGFSKLSDLSVKKPPKTSCLHIS